MFYHVNHVLHLKQLSSWEGGQVFLSCLNARLSAYRAILLSLVRAEGASVNGGSRCVIDVLVVCVRHFLMDADRCGFKAAARARYALVNVRNLNEGLLALLRCGFVGVKGCKEVRTSAIFRRRGRLRTRLFCVVLRVRLIFSRLGSERRRVNVSRPARRVIRYARVFIYGPFNGAVARQYRSGGQCLFMLLLGVAPSVGAVIVSHAQRTGRRVRQCAFGLPRHLFFNKGL